MHSALLAIILTPCLEISVNISLDTLFTVDIYHKYFLYTKNVKIDSTKISIKFRIIFNYSYNIVVHVRTV